MFHFGSLIEHSEPLGMALFGVRPRRQWLWVTIKPRFSHEYRLNGQGASH